MSELVKLIEGLGSAVDEMRKSNDRAIEELQKGNEARAREFELKADRANTEISELQKEIKKREAEQRAVKERIEILEAVSTRPGNTVQDKARNELTAAFMGALRKGFTDMDALHQFKAAQQKAVDTKAVTIGTPADGGYAVPEEISRAIEALLLSQSDVVSQVKLVTVGTSDYKELVSRHGTTSAWIAETGTRSATGTAALIERAPTWGELYAYPSVSNWALEDVFFDVQSWLVNDAAEGMSRALATAIYNGNGSAKPTGLFNTSPTSSADYSSPLRTSTALQYVPADSTSPQAIKADDVIDLVYALNPRYRAGAKFAMNTVTQGYMRKLKDTYGQYLWQPSLQAGQPDRLLGYEVFTWEDLANPTTADGFSVAFGDFRRAYLLAQRTGMAIDRNPYATIGYTAFYLRKRWGGIILNHDAVKVLKLADS